MTSATASIDFSEHKTSELFRADRTRVTAACEDLGTLRAHQRDDTTGQRRYTLIIPMEPRGDLYTQAVAILRSRFPHAVIEAIHLGREPGEHWAQAQITFSPTPSTDQIAKIEVEHGDHCETFRDGNANSLISAVEDHLGSIRPGAYAPVCIHFTGIAHPVDPITVYVPTGRAVNLRRILLGRGIY